jgi:hypothetical protein
MERSPQIFVRPIPEACRFDLVIKHDGYFAKELLFASVTEGDMAPSTMSLSTLEAQALMDRLWTAGLRPSEGSGSAGALAATERHLKDMQKLVFPPEIVIREFQAESKPPRNNWGIEP